jgi:hypothetical protein
MGSNSCHLGSNLLSVPGAELRSTGRVIVIGGVLLVVFLTFGACERVQVSTPLQIVQANCAVAHF